MAAGARRGRPHAAARRRTPHPGPPRPASRTPVQERRREPAGAGRRGRPAGAAAGPAGDRDRRRGGAGAGADESGLRQVLGNLLGNVRVHTPVEAPVALAVTREAGVVRLTVADGGPGLAADDAARVFDRFFRAGGAAGSGLGMAIVHGVVAAHGGEVSVRTEPGAGFTVTVYLPVGRPAATEGRDLRNGRGLRRGRDLRNGQGLRRGRDLRNGRSPRRGKGLRNGRSPRRGRGLRRGLGAGPGSLEPGQERTSAHTVLP
ncbi:sensor histidine kinase [Streptomyces sp. KL116D]|uniref:sensor histidine kinase n=1 Tax=Streptomyces sp. KL116D TaxID=3045152 RepID=UPI003555D27E